MTQEVFENLSRSAQERYLLQKEILSGKYGEPGLPFMTTRALANARQISVVTAHNILSELCDTGYLELRGKKYYLSHAKLMEDHYRHTNIIGMLVPQLNNEFFSSLCDTVVESFRQKGYEVLILNATYSAEEERKLIQDAKTLLMDRNHMTEEEAHRYIQKCSMDSGNSLVETARMVFSLMKF